MPAKYVLTHKGTGYHWNLLATNGRVIAASENYNSKAAAMTGIRSVQKNASTEVIRHRRGTDGQPETRQEGARGGGSHSKEGASKRCRQGVRGKDAVKSAPVTGRGEPAP